MTAISGTILIQPNAIDMDKACRNDKIIRQVFLMTVTSGIPPTDQTPILSKTKYTFINMFRPIIPHNSISIM